MATYRFLVVTPESTVYDNPVTMIITRSVEGEIGILAHHMHIITPLVPHVLTIHEANGKTLQLVIAGGFLEVGEDKTVLLADSAEGLDEIDWERAETARQRASNLLREGSAELDVARAKRALARAENRLKVKSRTVIH